MADQITDNRPVVFTGDTVANFVDLAGGAAGTLDTEIKIKGAGSIGEYLSNTLGGLLYDTGAAQNWANNVFYFLFNCGIVGLVDTKANGGFRVRFCGATVTNWFEVYVAGSDAWPPSIEGGWTPFVVDIETARATAITNGWTNGTVPSTSAIRYVGWAGKTGGTMPRMVDNTWMDECRRLPDGSPGIIVEGRNGGTTDWNFADIVTQIGISSGIAKIGDGGAKVFSTSIQFGINDSSTHGFTDTNSVVLWDNQEFAPGDLYGFTGIGGSGGTTNVTLGVQSGAGATATGSQGATIAADEGGVRWSMDFDDVNVDSVGLYGCTFIHGGDFQLDSIAVDSIDTKYIDCTSMSVDNGTGLKTAAVNPDTASSTSFLTTSNLNQLDKYSFISSGTGHAVELTSIGGGSMTWDCTTSGYDAGVTGSPVAPTNTGNETIYVSATTGTITINVADGATVPSIRSAGAVVNVVVPEVTVTFTGLVAGGEFRIYDDDLDGNPITIGTNREGVESLASDSYVLTHSASESGNLIRVQYMNPNNYEEEVINVPLTSNNQIINLKLIPEENA